MKYNVNGAEISKSKAIEILKYRKNIKDAITIDIQCNCANIKITPNGIKHIKENKLATFVKVKYNDFTMVLTKSQFKQIENKLYGHAKYIITNKRVIEPYEKYNLEYILQELIK